MVLQNALLRATSFTAVVWTDGVFRVTNYPARNLGRLKLTIQTSQSRLRMPMIRPQAEEEQLWPTRDTVFEALGYLCKATGAKSGESLWSRERKVKLPIDFAEVTTRSLMVLRRSGCFVYLAPACNQLREHITRRWVRTTGDCPVVGEVSVVGAISRHIAGLPKGGSRIVVEIMRHAVDAASDGLVIVWRLMLSRSRRTASPSARSRRQLG